MFYNISCEMNIKKVIHVHTFYAFYWFLMCNYLLFYNTCYLYHPPEKWHFQSLQSLLLTVFNLQALDWVHCEEETGAHTGISRLPSKLVSFFFILKLFILPKNKRISKNYVKFIIIFFFKNRYSSIFTKSIDNFKFSISLKSYEE